MKLLQSIRQSTKCQNFALILILGIFIFELGLFISAFDKHFLDSNLFAAYKNPSIVFHLRVMTALVIIVVVIPSTLKGQIIRFIPNISGIDRNIAKFINKTFAWFSAPWRVHILLFPLIAFNLLGLAFLVEQSPWLTPDSIEFLNFAPWRTAAYPIFFRFIAIWLGDPRWLVMFQFLATILIIIIFAESLSRLFVKPIIGFFTGFMLLTSWPFLYNSFALLADQIFILCLTAHLASISFAAKSRSQTSFVSAGVFAGFAIAFKPAGIFLIFSIPFLLLFFRDRLRSLIIMILPFLVIIAGSIFLNYWLFSSVSLSNIGGATTSVNSFLLLQKDTSALPQKLARSIAASGEIHQLALGDLKHARDRSDYFRNHVTILNTKAVTLAADNLEVQTNIDSSPNKNKEYLFRLFGQKSDLNQKYNKFATSEFQYVPWHAGLDNWLEINECLTEIALQAILENKIQWLRLTFYKFYAGWIEVVPFFSMKRNLGPNIYLENSISNELLKSRQSRDWWASGFSRYWVNAFDLVASATFALSILVPLPILILCISLFVAIRTIRLVLNRQHTDPVIAVLAYSAVCLILYHLEMSVVQVHFPRLLTAGMPPAVILVVSILGFRKLIESSKNSSIQSD